MIAIPDLELLANVMANRFSSIIRHEPFVGLGRTVWIYCAVTYNFLLGFGLGWIPALILALLVVVATIFFWPLAAVAVLFVIYRVFGVHPELLSYIAAFVGIIAIAMSKERCWPRQGREYPSEIGCPSWRRFVFRGLMVIFCGLQSGQSTAANTAFKSLRLIASEIVS